MLLGFDIGGTKCAAIAARWDGETIHIQDKRKIPTDLACGPEKMIRRLMDLGEEIAGEQPEAIGISCGGPLDSQKGVILGPPNLPGWDRVDIVRLASARFASPAYLQNDANACALAEWKFGAGKGSKNMIFLTFGTGLGAGLVLDGRLYAGANDNAGECGHIRLERFGPSGYGKAGSFEGFCSGGGLAQLGYTLALEQVQQGTRPAYFPEGTSKHEITAKTIADAARQGDRTAQRVYAVCGEYLGRGLSILIDLINPERIVLGGIFTRCEDLLRPAMEQAIQGEALSAAAACCRVRGAALGEEIGDYAAIAVALFSKGGKDECYRI
ncbi:ROK family protein [Acutalibacter sp. 1XD8-33]|uniref:ROK family protein n=1 Tax=Acutalibacter sp. 1XD8-33 TaxID=2320081 RepID=UPI000EA0C19E|nr:ROK family protein [Acutalibacter sp. 1XD8-33]RKJ40715.1 ROK family protein [Acutalibacter sp. 1XD8-33]